jgi:hypothetical protein
VRVSKRVDELKEGATTAEEIDEESAAAKVTRLRVSSTYERALSVTISSEQKHQDLRSDSTEELDDGVASRRDEGGRDASDAKIAEDCR